MKNKIFSFKLYKEGLKQLSLISIVGICISLFLISLSLPDSVKDVNDLLESGFAILTDSDYEFYITSGYSQQHLL